MNSEAGSHSFVFPQEQEAWYLKRANAPRFVRTTNHADGVNVADSHLLPHVQLFVRSGMQGSPLIILGSGSIPNLSLALSLCRCWINCALVCRLKTQGAASTGKLAGIPVNVIPCGGENGTQTFLSTWKWTPSVWLLWHESISSGSIVVVVIGSLCSS